tara:strand:- start:5470 stop:6090 length:621 start_codon:yes stop_codon:yes gene_type:complete
MKRKNRKEYIMNTTDFLVIIIVGFILTNFAIDKIQEGFDVNSESSINDLIRKIKTGNVANQQNVKNVTTKINDILKKYNTLNMHLDAHANSQKLSEITSCKSHKSIPCGPPSPPLPNRPPKSGCPNKHTEITWPTPINQDSKNADPGKPLISEVDSVQVNDWRKTYLKEKQNTENIEMSFIKAYNIAQSINSLGNTINAKLQKNNF